MPQRVDLTISPACLNGLPDEGDMVKQYGLLEQAMLQAGDDQIITPLPESNPGASRSAYSNSRLKVIANRLFLLGYLDTDSVPSQLDASYQAGVKLFQHDAFGISSLKADGWVGEKTWLALQQMVSFEEASNLEKWFVKAEPCHALIRAAYLRLYALGLVSRAPGHLKTMVTIDLLNNALAGFSKLAQVLGWADAAGLSVASLATLKLLFDQDEMVARLASGQIPKAVEHKKTIKPFIIAMAKIELWLLGYNIRPKGYTGGSANSMRANGLDLKAKSQLYKQLLVYWTSLGITSDKAKSKAMGLIKSTYPKFFSSISQRLIAADVVMPTESEDVYQEIKKLAKSRKPKKNMKSVVQEMWDNIYSIGARMWDGIKRAWAWFKAMVKKAVSSVKAMLKNLSRVAYLYIRNSFEALQAVVSGVTGSLAFFARKEIKFPMRGLNINSNIPVLRMHRDNDFDFTTLVYEFAQANDVSKIAAYLENKSAMFAVSCGFLASLLKLVIDLIKKSIFTGWPALLMALLRLYKSIKQWAPVIIGFEKQERRMLSLEAT